MDTYLIEAILLDDGGRKHTRQEIFAYFQDTRDIAARTEFLKNSYNDIWVEVLAGADKVRVGYHAEKDGLLMWEGSYLSRTAESVFSWGVVTEMTENLIERGAYKIKLGLQNAPVMAEQLSFFDIGGGAAVYEVPEAQRTGELFSARTVPQAVIDQALYTAGNSYNSAYRVAVFYTRQRSEAECIAFLRREFGTENGRGMDNLLESLPLKEQACREKLSDLHNQLETAKVEVLKPFPREEELQTKLARLEELNALLNMDKREPEVVAETEAPDNSQQPPTRKTTELER